MHGPTEFGDVEAHRLPQKAEDADFVACISDFARSQLMALIGPDAWSRLHIVHCGINPGGAPDGRTEAGGPLRLLCVGQLVARKGHGVLIEALAELAGTGLEVEATFAGAGPERDRLERMARDLGVGDSIRFLGAVGQDEVPALYRDAGLFCLASFAEGVPVVLMEAMAHEVPVVATRIAGIPELVADGETGLLVAPGRASDLAAAIRRLAEDPSLAARLARAGREHVQREYDQSRSAAQLRDLFEAIAR